MNPYEVLEISVGASPEEIKAAYHGMAKKWHPDRYTGPAKVEAEQRFRLLAEAYSMLKDAPRREEREAQAAASAAPAPAAKAAAPVQPEGAPEERPAQNRTVDEWFKDAKAAAEAKAPERALGLIQYAIRLDGERAEFHALHGKLLDELNGDKRALVRALETALRLNPRDVDSTILLAQTFQGLGLHARASRLWNVVRNLAPNHPLFAHAGSPAGKEKGKGKAPDGEPAPGMGEQFASLVAGAKDAVSRIFKRG